MTSAAAVLDDASLRRVGMIAVHTSPLEQPGSGDSGGLNVVVSSTARELARRGIEVDVFTRSRGGDVPPTVTTADGVRVHHLKAGPASATKDDLATHLCAFWLAFAKHPAVADLDLLHGHYWMSGWVGRVASRRLGLPLVQTFHTLAHAKNDSLAPGDRPEPALRLAAEERIAGDADALIAATRAEADLLRSRYRAPASRLHVVEPGVDLDVFTPEGDRLHTRQQLGGGRLLLFVGRLQPLKAPDDAIRALAALDDVLPDDGIPTRLLVVGGPSGAGIGRSDPPALRRLAEQLGVGDRVAFLAPRPQAELAALYRAADAVVVPSHSESFGLVALEAQACGTPVVAAANGGLLSAVADGAGGRLVHDRDPRAFARALAPYLTDASERHRASLAGRRHAEAHSWREVTGRTLDVYERVLDRGDAMQRWMA